MSVVRSAGGVIVPRLVTLLVVGLLVVPTATVAAGDQELKVRILPADTLAITVSQSVDFGTLEVGQTGHVDIDIGIVNTTAGGWEITVSGDDLTSSGTSHVIDKANLVITGGDTDRWGAPGAVESFSGSPGAVGSPLKIVQGTAEAWGEFSLDSPKARLELTIPAGTDSLREYQTVLTYTITASPGS